MSEMKCFECHGKATITVTYVSETKAAYVRHWCREHFDKAAEFLRKVRRPGILVVEQDE